MKSFDLYKKSKIDEVSKQTILGAIISFFALSLMFYVLIKQLNEYFFIPLILKDTIIFQDELGTSTIPANFNIIFPNLVCSIISVDQEDIIGHHKLNIEDTLIKTPIDKNRLPNGNKFDAHKTKDLSTAIKNQEGCIVSGNVPISKVQGDIHFSFHAYREVFSYLITHELNNEVSMAHKFNLLNFGDEEKIKKVLKSFGMQDNETKFNRVVNLPNNESYNNNYDFDYFIKIIPQIFEDKYTGETVVGYQYSLTYKAKERSDYLNMPIIIINYDYSPVAVKYTKEIRYFTHLITNMCALTGGIFVIFSLINSFLLNIADDIRKRDNFVKTNNSIN